MRGDFCIKEPFTYDSGASLIACSNIYYRTKNLPPPFNLQKNVL